MTASDEKEMDLVKRLIARADAQLHLGNPEVLGYFSSTDEKILREAAAEIEQLNFTFDLQWEADQRAIKSWQAAHPGNDRVWPDRCCMVIWLMEQLATAESKARDMREQTIEECAKLCDDCSRVDDNNNGAAASGAAADAAARIRALINKERG